jgi:hypothetical protein
MDERAKSSDALALARGVYAVGQEDDDDVLFRVDPQRCPGKSEVTNGGR